MTTEIRNPKSEAEAQGQLLGADERLMRVLLANAEQRAAIDRILEGKKEAPAPAAPAQQAEPFITKAEAARRLNRDVRTLSIWMRKGLVPYYKIGHTVAFKWSEVEMQLAATCRVNRSRY